MNELKNIIQELRIESTQFNVSDVLVNVSEDNSNLFFSEKGFSFDLNQFPKKIINDANKIKKESGVNPLCSVRGIVSIQLGDKFVFTPVFLCPLDYQIDKIKQRITFTKLDDEIFINPFLIHHLENTFDILTTENSEVDSFKRLLKQSDLVIEQEERSIIGNFHHHRYQIVKELDDVIRIETYPSTLKNLLGFGELNSSYSFKLPPDNLFFADTDHEKAFNSIELNDTVIQGPPGTGKSQALTNILGKALAENKTTIVVSEKRAALDVLKMKLNEFNLDQLCFIATSDHLSHSFFEELKTTWNYFEQYDAQHTNNIRLSEQYVNQLQMILDLIRQEELIGGVPFSEFFKDIETINIDQFDYGSQIDTIRVFKQNRELILSIYDRGLNSPLGNIKQSTINSKEFNEFDKKLDYWIKSIEKLKTVFPIVSFDDLQKMTKEAIQCQIFENEYYKKYNPLFEPNSTDQKTFLSLRKKYLKAKVEIENIQKNNSHWKIIPSQIETLSLLKVIDNTSFFKRIHTKKRWKELANTPFEDAKNQLNIHSKNIHLKIFT